MIVRFWGTRGSLAKPGPTTLRYGGNTSCVEARSADGTLIVLDCGTGAHGLGHRLTTEGAPRCDGHLMITHTHWDHIQGFPFFSPAFVKGNTAAIYGPEGSRGSLQDVLAGQMEFTYFPVALNQLPAAITYHDLTEGDYTIDGVRVATQFLNHPAMTIGYRVEADGVVVVYLVDHEPFSDQLWRASAAPGSIESILHEGDRRHASFMAGADLVIHDAQYTPQEYQSRKTWGHSAYDYVVQVAAAAGVRRLALTHHDPTHDDHFIAELEREARALAQRCGTGLDVFCAYEGCEIVLEGGLPRGATATKPSRQASVAQRTFHVLVVDDQPDMVTLIVRALESDHYTVSTATSGQAALRSIGERMPDIVVLDYKMNGMDGLEVMKTLRAGDLTRLLPVLMLTAMSDEPSTRAGFDAGVTDYVTKPFSIPQLTARVRACLARAQLQ